MICEEDMLKFEKNLNVEYYTLKEFDLISGESLKDLVVEYLTIGKPAKNEKGEIINGITFFHGLGGSCTSIKRLHKIIANKKALDTGKYFIISITTLGSPNSYCPSNSDLGVKFPSYTIEDMVNFQKEFLYEKFRIKHLKGLIGNSMGGFEALTWGVLYPGDMDFIISLVSSYKCAGHEYAIAKIVNTIIENDPEYNNGYYNKALKSIGLANQVVYPIAFSMKHYMNLSNDEIDKDLNEAMLNFKTYDGNDVILRNNASSCYNIENELDKIIAETLIIAINQDQYFPPELNAIVMSKMIKNSKLIIYDSDLGHLGTGEIFKVENELKEFLNQYG
ncbi:MAG: alpha/beta fold hydrolase [Methanobrevibacter sp.]|jgi:homoserine O-acetyltransferase|nr:alpha/beta fold hydrolase [Candidatus Methanovirga basalitermitum]